MNAQADKDEQNALKQAGDVILDVYDVKNQHIFQKRDVARDQPSFLFEDVSDIFFLDTKIRADTFSLGQANRTSRSWTRRPEQDRLHTSLQRNLRRIFRRFYRARLARRRRCRYIERFFSLFDVTDL